MYTHVCVCVCLSEWPRKCRCLSDALPSADHTHFLLSPLVHPLCVHPFTLTPGGTGEMSGFPRFLFWSPRVKTKQKDAGCCVISVWVWDCLRSLSASLFIFLSCSRVYVLTLRLWTCGLAVCLPTYLCVCVCVCARTWHKTKPKMFRSEQNNRVNIVIALMQRWQEATWLWKWWGDVNCSASFKMHCTSKTSQNINAVANACGFLSTVLNLELSDSKKSRTKSPRGVCSCCIDCVKTHTYTNAVCFLTQCFLLGWSCVLFTVWETWREEEEWGS